MDIQSVSGQGFRQRHLAQRLARPGPDLPQRAEEWTEIDPGTRSVAVVVRYVHRRQASLETFQIDPLTCFRYRDTR